MMYDVAAEVDAVNAVGSVGVNTAVSECVPTVNVDVEAVALPAATGTAAPMLVAPSLNCTEPAADAGESVAVSDTAAPATAVPAGETPSVVLVAVGLGATTVTEYGTATEVDAVNAVASVGAKAAVKLCGPTASELVDMLALPAATGTAAPSAVAPSRNCTVPAAAGVTVAVSETDAPDTAEPAGATISAVVVWAGPTTAVMTYDVAAEVEAVNAVASVGVNTAVSECVPTVNVDVEALALPAATGTAAPMLVAPSLNCTEPAAFDGDNVAVIDTAAPATAVPAGETANAVLVATGTGAVIV